MLKGSNELFDESMSIQKMMYMYKNKLFQLPKHIQNDILKKAKAGMCSKDIAKWLRENGYRHRPDTVTRYLELRKFMKKIAKIHSRRTIKNAVVHDAHYALIKMCSNSRYQDALEHCQMINRGPNPLLRNTIPIQFAISICEKFLDDI